MYHCRLFSPVFVTPIMLINGILIAFSVQGAISLYHQIGTEPSSKLYHLKESEKDGLKDLADSLTRAIPRNIPERSVYPTIMLEDGDSLFIIAHFALLYLALSQFQFLV
jgi:hypothetical protein